MRVDLPSINTVQMAIKAIKGPATIYDIIEYLLEGSELPNEEETYLKLVISKKLNVLRRQGYVTKHKDNTWEHIR